MMVGVTFLARKSIHIVYDRMVSNILILQSRTTRYCYSTKSYITKKPNKNEKDH